MHLTWRLRVCAALTAGLLVAGVTAALVLPLSGRGLPAGRAVALGAPGAASAIGVGGGAQVGGPGGDSIAQTRVVVDGVRDSAELAALRRLELDPAASRRGTRSGGRSTTSTTARSVAGPPLIWPAKGALTGWWHEQRGGRDHLGVDIDGDTGDPVWAAGGGRVVHAGPAPAGYSGYGLLVVIDHGGGETVYAHLSRIDVAAGQVVDAGTPLGAMGTSGNVTGSHLHFEVRIAGRQVDPIPYLPRR